MENYNYANFKFIDFRQYFSRHKSKGLERNQPVGLIGFEPYNLFNLTGTTNNIKTPIKLKNTPK